MLSVLQNLKERLDFTLIAGTKFINDDFKLKKAIEDFKEISKSNPVFEKIQNICESIFTCENKNETILDAISLVDAVLYTQAKNDVSNINEFGEMEIQESEILNVPLKVLTSDAYRHYEFNQFLKNHPEFMKKPLFWDNYRYYNYFSSIKGDIVLPDFCEKIDEEMFLDCENVTSIKIPSSVKKIEKNAFRNCRSLEKVYLPSTITEIGLCIFYNCKSLKEITIPSSVTKIEKCAFYGCESLESVIIPDSVTEIEASAFEGCSKLKNIVLPKNLEKIGEDAFKGCDI